jgi:hypothetical protein
MVLEMFRIYRTLGVMSPKITVGGVGVPVAHGRQVLRDEDELEGGGGVALGQRPHRIRDPHQPREDHVAWISTQSCYYHHK